MSDLTHQNLESFERNLLNEHGQRTLGNVLCEKAGLWAPGQHFQSFVTVSVISKSNCTKLIRIHLVSFRPLNLYTR